MKERRIGCREGCPQSYLWRPAPCTDCHAADVADLARLTARVKELEEALRLRAEAAIPHAPGACRSCECYAVQVERLREELEKAAGVELKARDLIVRMNTGLKAARELADACNSYRNGGTRIGYALRAFREADKGGE